MELSWGRREDSPFFSLLRCMDDAAVFVVVQTFFFPFSICIGGVWRANVRLPSPIAMHRVNIPDGLPICIYVKECGSLVSDVVCVCVCLWH